MRERTSTEEHELEHDEICDSDYANPEIAGREIIKVTPILTDAPTKQLSDKTLQQPLQTNQRSGDLDYEETTWFRAEHEFEQITSDENYDTVLPKPEKTPIKPPLKLNQRCNDAKTSKEGAVCDDIKAAKTKIKIVLLGMLTVNIVILLLLTVLAIVGGIQIQSKFEQVVSAHVLSIKINELTASTNVNFSQILQTIDSEFNNRDIQQHIRHFITAQFYKQQCRRADCFDVPQHISGFNAAYCNQQQHNINTESAGYKSKSHHNTAKSAGYKPR